MCWINKDLKDLVGARYHITPSSGVIGAKKVDQHNIRQVVMLYVIVYGMVAPAAFILKAETPM